MSIVGEDSDRFFDRYNEDLERLDSGVRVAPAISGMTDAMTIVDLDGKTIGDLPRSIDPAALAAVMLLVEKSFEEGVQTGRALERAEN
jgi:hypothetical protein